jgi:hypothetical protein
VLLLGIMYLLEGTFAVGKEDRNERVHGLPLNGRAEAISDIRCGARAASIKRGTPESGGSGFT